MLNVKLCQWPLTGFEYLNNLVKKWTLPQADLHTALNLEIRVRKLAVTTIKGKCALFQQTIMTMIEKRNETSLMSSQLGFSVTDEMNDSEAAKMVICKSQKIGNFNKTFHFDPILIYIVPRIFLKFV